MCNNKNDRYIFSMAIDLTIFFFSVAIILLLPYVIDGECLNILLLVISIIIYYTSINKKKAQIESLVRFVTLLTITITGISIIKDLNDKEHYTLMFILLIFLAILFISILISYIFPSYTLATKNAIFLWGHRKCEQIKNNTAYMKRWAKRRKKDAIEIKIKGRITSIKKSKHTLRNRMFYHRGLVEISILTEALLKLEAKEKYMSIKLRKLKSKWKSDD